MRTIPIQYSSVLFFLSAPLSVYFSFVLGLEGSVSGLEGSVSGLEGSVSDPHSFIPDPYPA
jgi:hypothetical protein